MDIQQVARKAKVSVATVSRAFNKPEMVAARTREHVTRVARALGYVPNATARTLRTSRSRVLGVVLPTLSNPVFAECLDGIAEAAAAAGYSIMPMTSRYDAAAEAVAVRHLLAGNVDAQLLVVADPAASAALEALAADGLPYVLVYNRHPAHPCIGVDNTQAVIDVLLRLGALGHRSVAMVSGELKASDRAQQRYAGFKNGARQAGIDGRLLEVPFMETAQQRLAALLSGPARPTALVCSNDLLALRSIRAARAAGLDVPRDISVVGFDGIAIGRETTPALTTVAQPNAAMGHTAVQLLLSALASGRRPSSQDSVTLPHAFVVGESCGPAPH